MAHGIRRGAGRSPAHCTCRGPMARGIWLTYACSCRGGTAGVVDAGAAPFPDAGSHGQPRSGGGVDRAASEPERDRLVRPEMCGQVQKSGFPVARLRSLPPMHGDSLGSGVVVSTPAVRNQFGARLATVYAPLVIHGTHIPGHPGGQENPDRGKWRCGRAVRNRRAQEHSCLVSRPRRPLCQTPVRHEDEVNLCG